MHDMVSRLRSDESGFTLMEVLVATMVGTIVMLALLGLADAATRSARSTDSRADAAQRARPALDQMSQLLRSAACIKNGTTSTALPIVSGSDTSLTFYAQVISASAVNTFKPKKYTLTFTPDAAGNGDGQFTLTTIDGNGPYPTTDFTVGNPNVTQSTRLVLAGARPTGAAPVFRYYAYDASGNLDPYNGATPLSASSGLSATDVAKVAMIRIAFTEKASGKRPISNSDSSYDQVTRLRLADPTSPTPQNGALCRV
jgi:prepilin-type N-terminal cleavage/methylation domain-containing protein